MTCFYNLKTGEIVTIPNFSQISDEDELKEVFRDDLKKVSELKADFIKFEVLKSFESFKIMEQFIAQITDQNYQSELQNILQKRKPFQNFKHSIDNSDFRQKWFDFKLSELEKIVKNQLEWQKTPHMIKRVNNTKFMLICKVFLFLCSPQNPMSFTF